MEFQCIFKNVKTKTKIFRQSWPILANFQTFSRFGLISLDHKWNRTRLLLPEIEIWVASQAAERLKTWDPRKSGNFSKINKMLGFYDAYPAGHPKAKYRCFSVKNWKKSAVKDSIRKNYFALFCEFVSKLLFKTAAVPLISISLILMI